MNTSSSITIRDWLEAATSRLNKANVLTARLDCLILLEDATVQDRSHLLAHPETILEKAQISTLNQQIERRLKHEPLAYIRGFSSFYGHRFTVSKRVLVPRPETEDIIDTLKRQPLSRSPRIADVGTGSGCLGITAALEIPGSTVDLFDNDKLALAIAKSNADSLKVKVGLYEMNLLADNQKIYDVIIANLPYVPELYEINEAAMHEPRQAIFGGPNGLGFYNQLFDQLSSFSWRPSYVLTESLPIQHDQLKEIAMINNFRLDQTQGYIQTFIPV